MNFPRPSEVYDGTVCASTGNQATPGFESKKELLVRGGGPYLACDQLSAEQSAELTAATDALRTGAAIGRHSSAGLVLGVEHAQLLASHGFSKADVQQWLSEHAVRSHADLERAGKSVRGQEAENIDERGLHMLPHPEQIPIIVAGARNAAMSMVIRPFGFGGWSRTAHPIQRVVPTEAGGPAR